MPHVARPLRIKLEMPTEKGLQEWGHAFALPHHQQMKAAAEALLLRFSRACPDAHDEVDVTYTKNGQTKRYDVESGKWESVHYDPDVERVGAFYVRQSPPVLGAKSDTTGCTVA